MTETRNHILRTVEDSCHLHGIGLTPCRTCMTNDRVGNTYPRHRADMATVEGFDVRMGF